jgi:small subunit ribosomal protein S2
MTKEIEDKTEKQEKLGEIEELKEKSQIVLAEDKEIERMFKVGLHFGHKRARKHPKMEPFIYGIRNNIDIIDLLKTKEYLKEALDYLKQKKKEGALILFVGTKISVRKLIKELAEEIKMPYVIERWLGGTLTNFEVMSGRIKYLKELEEKTKKGEFEKFTKKERIRINQELARIERKIGGLRELSRLPDTLFIVDVKKEELAIREAKAKGISIVGICDTDGDPTSVDYPIPANDDSVPSLKYILEKVKKVLS